MTTKADRIVYQHLRGKGLDPGGSSTPFTGKIIRQIPLEGASEGGKRKAKLGRPQESSYNREKKTKKPNRMRIVNSHKKKRNTHGGKGRKGAKKRRTRRTKKSKLVGGGDYFTVSDLAESGKREKGDEGKREDKKGRDKHIARGKSNRVEIRPGAYQGGLGEKGRICSS